MNPFLEKMFNTMGPLNLFPGTLVPLHHNTQGPSKSIDFETGLMLSNLVQYRKPKTIVELGTFRGYSTAWLLLGSQLCGDNSFTIPDVHAFEVFKEGAYGSMWYDTLEMRLDNFRYHEIPGGIWKFPDEIPETIDFLFHDTQHSLNPTMKEMEVLLPRIPVGGMIVIDDMLHPDYRPMQEYFHKLFSVPLAGHVIRDLDEWKKYCSLNTGWNWTVLPIGHGLGLAERLR